MKSSRSGEVSEGLEALGTAGEDASATTHCTAGEFALAEQLCDDFRRGLERGVDLCGVFAAGLGDLGSASA